ncbi:MAG TPA: hypothetical protein ENJ95_20070 [Bacteroidetes bacterium]|nr:hypothetical protein [Bacteroidota bacterium]
MKNILRFLFASCLAFFFLSAGDVPQPSPSSGFMVSGDTLRYFFAGHTYFWGHHKRVDFRLEALDYSIYDRVWLGGDVTSEALSERSIIEYLDSLFDLSDPGNHWTLGNHCHRNGNLEWYEEVTGRRPYHAHYQDGITTVVMNTNLNPSNCEDLDRQFHMVANVCDSIQASSHLILLMHHHIWKDVPGLPPPSFFGNGGLEHWNTNCYDADNYFSNTIYPKLLEVKARGIEVLCIMGDAGWNKGGAALSDDGINFLSSGINNTFFLPDTVAFQNAPKDKVLIFEHIPDERLLRWEYQDLDSLYEAHK